MYTCKFEIQKDTGYTYIYNILYSATLYFRYMSQDHVYICTNGSVDILHIYIYVCENARVHQSFPTPVRIIAAILQHGKDFSLRGGVKPELPHLI